MNQKLFGFRLCIRTSFVLSLALLFLTACGGGGSGGGVPSSGSDVEQTGIFLDSAVSGLRYETKPSGKTGVTDANGQFRYRDGDTVSFYVGEIHLGSAAGAAVITPLTLIADATSVSDSRVVNIARFLQSLDEDRDPETNGIVILPVIANAASGTGIKVDFSSSEFEPVAEALVKSLRAEYGDSMGLVDRFSAEAHLNSMIIADGSDVDEKPDKNDPGMKGNPDGSDNGGTGTGSNPQDCEVSNPSGSDSRTRNRDRGVDPCATDTGDGGTTDPGAGTGDTDAGAGSGTGAPGSDTGADTGTGTGSGDSGGATDGSGSGSGSGTGSDGDSGSSSPPFTTDPDLSVGDSIYATIQADFSSYESSEITIGAPLIAENGAVVPVNVTFPPKRGSLWLFTDSNTVPVIMKADFLQPGTNGRFDTRIKQKQSGNIMAVFVAEDGTRYAARKYVTVTIGAEPAACLDSDCTGTFPTVSTRIRSNNGATKMLITNEMSMEDYVTSVSISVNGSVDTVVYLTPYISRNPYLRVQHADIADIEIVVDIKATGQRTAGESTRTR